MSGLKTRAIQSVKWNTLSMGVTTLLQIVQMVWLARLLEPYEWGIMAMVWVIIRLAMPLMQGGIGQAIIQSKTLSKIQFSSLFWIQWAMGLLSFVAVNAMIPLWIFFFEESDIGSLLFISSLSFLCASPGNVFQALFTRRLEFKNWPSFCRLALA
ncbi:MAG: oligosaccharide flippase family protein [Saprospirales bacterium]|nr:oligosaccharide flippase family protein [Saprospirales bacterium]